MSIAALLPRKTEAEGRKQRLRRFRRHRAGMLSAAGLALLILFSLMASPLGALLGIDPGAADLLARYEPPSLQHWLGTDEAGRDELVRLMLGGQMSLLIGLAATGLATLIGLSVGLAAGYAGGRLDAALMRITDGVIALPLLPLVIVLGAVDLTKLGFPAAFAQSPAAAVGRLVVIIALVEWTSLARVVRAGTLTLKERDFVRAAWAIGAGPFHVLTRHVLPNLAAPVTVTATLTVGRVILFESVLSFLGFGIVPPTPSWGNMLTNAQELMTAAPALALWPGLLIFVTVILVNMVGEGMQHAFDVRSDP
jgi:peptide/nickel transport system permease protein